MNQAELLSLINSLKSAGVAEASFHADPFGYVNVRFSQAAQIEAAVSQGLTKGPALPTDPADLEALQKLEKAREMQRRAELIYGGPLGE